MPAVSDKQLWTKGTWVEGVKAFNTLTIIESASVPHLAPGDRVVDSVPY